MLMNHLIESAVVSLVSASFATNNVSSSWGIVSGYSTGSIDDTTDNVVQVVSGQQEPLIPFVNTGVYKVNVSIMTTAKKTFVTPTEFETVSDYTFNPFLRDDVVQTLSTYAPALKIHAVTDAGLSVETVNDGWLASQDLTLVIARTI